MIILGAAAIAAGLLAAAPVIAAFAAYADQPSMGNNRAFVGSPVLRNGKMASLGTLSINWVMDLPRSRQ